MDIIADNFTADAVSGINVGTTIVSVDASTSGVGDLVLTETDGITLGDVNTVDGAITVMAGDTITAIDVESLTDADGNDITLTSTGGGIEVGLINAGTTEGDIILDAQGGSITDDGDVDVDIIADNFIADAVSGINVDTTIASVDASTSGVGNLVLTETDGITLSDVNTADGAITVMAGDTITAIDVESLTDADGNDITLTSTGGGIEVGLINAGTTQGDVILNAQVGTITDDNDSDVDIVANNLTADAVSGINLETSIISVNASTSGTGTIDLTETDGITLTDVDTANGSITVIAGGAITASNVESLSDADGNDIILTSTGGGIEVGLINAGATQGDIILDAQGGAITDDNDSGVDIVADSLTADAVNGINLDTTIVSIDASTNGTGNIELSESG